jgi:hypothetical protein
MSETARIREAARALSRQRPEDNRSLAYTAEHKPSAIDLVPKYRELAQRAAQDLNRRIRGIEGLFGEDVARPLEAATEELREMFYAALEMHDLAHHHRDEYVTRLRTQQAADVAELRAEVLRYRAYLGAARHQEARRRLRSGAERPAWYVKAEDLFDDEAPF